MLVIALSRLSLLPHLDLTYYDSTYVPKKGAMLAIALWHVQLMNIARDDDSCARTTMESGVTGVDIKVHVVTANRLQSCLNKVQALW